ncbi:hypothetical protein FB45DRAFT_862400 [Roridomyces roridus]|uniref:Uncharacterized protein n=1 Tax=Roridomyces roridus TaxID=1738132 RepID=A0AAD7FWC3_9AGAR|nr:hypothetical protein FB45DRAFT_862400 [Roridomyces roridus]
MCPCASTSLFWCCGFSPTSPIALRTSDQETKWQTLDGGYGHYVHAPGPLSGARTGNARIWSCRTAEAGRCLKRRFLAEGLSWFYVLWALNLYTLRAMMQRPANSAAGPQAGGGAVNVTHVGDVHIEQQQRTAKSSSRPGMKQPCLDSRTVHGTPGKNLEAMELGRDKPNGRHQEEVAFGRPPVIDLATIESGSLEQDLIRRVETVPGNGNPAQKSCATTSDV